MMKRFGVVSIACGLGIGVALGVASPQSKTQAQSADLVLCDRVAADPTDPDKPADVRGANDVAAADVATAEAAGPADVVDGGVGLVARRRQILAQAHDVEHAPAIGEDANQLIVEVVR